jgi:hypothetical protein
MDALQDSHINSGMQLMFHDHLDVWLGDPFNGIVARQVFGSDKFARAAAWLVDTALEHYPNSSFARSRRQLP